MRVALYARVSSQEQAMHGLSIDAQIASLDEWAKDKTVVDHYIDSGVSAHISASKRPELQRLLRDIERGKVDLVAFTRLDRWFRSVKEYYRVQDVLDSHNVSWRAIQEDYETESSSGKFKVNVMLSVAQSEAERTGERVKAVFEEKRRMGLAINGHMPPGLDFNNGKISPNDDAQKIREIFQHYASCRSLHATAYAAKEILGKQYSQRGMKQLLTNERYLASGVVSQDEWNTVQTLIKTRETRTVRSDRVYLFSGILKCPECGMKLTVRTRVYNGTDYVYYRCDRHDKGKRCSFNSSIRESRLEAYLLNRIRPELEAFNLEIAKRQKKPVDVSKFQKKLDRLTDLYVEGSIEKDEYEKRATPIRDAIKTAQSVPKPVNITEIMDAVDVYPTLSKRAQKAFWSVLIKSIVPTKDGFSVVFF